MSKSKKILIGILAVVVLVVVVQVINAEKHSMLVNVVEGENVVGLNPTTERLDFGDLSRNNRLVRHIAMQNGGNFSVYVVVWKFGELAELVQANKNFFTLKPGEEARLSFEASIPPSAEVRKYTGNVWIFRFPKPF